MFKARYCSQVILIAPLFCMALQAHGHTEVRDNAKEGQLSRNFIEIDHGCESGTGNVLPVIAQSVIIPTVNLIVTRSDGSLTTLSQEITIESLEGYIELPQNKDIFQQQRLVRSKVGNPIGFYGTQGMLRTDLKGVVPFNFGPLFFQSAGCAKTLEIEMAIADICKKSFPPKESSANTWIPRVTKKFIDDKNEGIGAPAILRVHRDLDANPLPPSCGLGYDVRVSPSDEDIDAHLIFKGWGK